MIPEFRLSPHEAGTPGEADMRSKPGLGPPVFPVTNPEEGYHGISVILGWIHEEFMEIHGNFMENSWKIHGNDFGDSRTSWKLHGNSWKIHGNHFMEIHGKFMEFMEFIENPWKDSCKIHGKFMEIHGKMP